MDKRSTNEGSKFAAWSPRIDFNDFAKRVREAGLQPVDKKNGHWQIRGGRLLVNYWASKGTIHIDGTTKGQRHRSVDDAIKAANHLPEIVDKAQQTDRPNRGHAKQVRHMLWRKQGGCCHWCLLKMIWGHAGATPEQHARFASIDHKIPVARGGNNGTNNLVLAHVECNNDRGCDMPEFDSWNCDTIADPEDVEPNVENQPKPSISEATDSGIAIGKPARPSVFSDKAIPRIAAPNIAKHAGDDDIAF